MLPISKSRYTQFLHFGEAVHISQFMPFYSVLQAVFLIFCFRWRVLQGRDDVDEEPNDDPGLNAAATNMKRASWITELDIQGHLTTSHRITTESVADKHQHRTCHTCHHYSAYE